MDFTENIRDIHIGNIIKEKLTEKSMTVAEFAFMINRERTTARDILKRKSIDTELLIKISQILDYDFIRSVYYGEKISPVVFIAVKMEEDELKKLDLPEEFVRFVKSKK